MPNKQNTIETRQRLQNALWGLFIGDALAMPAHWYYSVDNIRKVFDGGIRDYQEPPHPHLESFKEVPAQLKQGLIEFNKIQTEIEAFSDIALSGYAI